MAKENLQTNGSISQPPESVKFELPKRLTVLEAVAFKNEIAQLLQEQTFLNKIILDFSQTQFIDSSGIGALVSNVKLAKQNNTDLILESVQPPVMATLSIAGLTDVLQIGSSEKWSDKELLETHPSVSSWVKRSIDIVGSVIGLVILAILIIPISIAIKLDSPGSVFFSQVRCGWLGKEFKIWKFRSMSSDAEAQKEQIENQANGAFFKNDNDPRVTKVGKFLRRTSLDEFPQFWNVLRGEMSLVGTRPPTPDEVAAYQVPEWQRLNVKPGMTGEWQVNGRSNVRNFEDVIKMDLSYQNNWSLKYDLKLIFKTIEIIFAKDSGAV